MSFYPAPVMARLSARSSELSREWRAAIPLRIHSSGLDEGGGPAWHPDFERYLTRSGPAKDRVIRSTRKLRKANKRAYEVCYRVLVAGDSVSGTADWLNERAQRNRIELPRPYSEKDVVALLMVGIDWIHAHW